MLALLRSVLALLAGFIVGGLVNISIVFLNIFLCFPRDLDINDRSALAEALAQASPVVWLLPLVAHAGGTLVGAWLAAWLAGRAPLVHALIIGVVVLIGGIFNLREIPHPLWFGITDLALYLPAAWLGAMLVPRGKSPA